MMLSHFISHSRFQRGISGFCKLYEDLLFCIFRHIMFITHGSLLSATVGANQTWERGTNHMRGIESKKNRDKSSRNAGPPVSFQARSKTGWFDRYDSDLSRIAPNPKLTDQFEMQRSESDHLVHKSGFSHCASREPIEISLKIPPWSPLTWKISVEERLIIFKDGTQTEMSRMKDSEVHRHSEIWSGPGISTLKVIGISGWQCEKVQLKVMCVRNVSTLWLVLNLRAIWKKISRQYCPNSWTGIDWEWVLSL
jgi:hypothetical protein